MSSGLSISDNVIFCFGANHRSADIALREKFFATEDAIRERLPQIRRQFGFTELATLSTCNRFEIFGVSPVQRECGKPLNSILQDAFTSFEVLDRDTARQVQNVAYFFTGREAVRHLFSVASSLDSLVIGETQITGQFKRAMAIADEAMTTGPVLTRLAQDALAASKKVRTRTAIGRGRVSIGHAAIELVKKIFQDPSERHFAVLGAGEMAEETIRCILQHRPRSLTIVNRSLVRAHELLEKLSPENRSALDIRCVGLDSLNGLDDVLAAADVFISATSASSILVSRATVANAVRRRRSRTLLMVDIALPRDIDPSCSTLEEVYLFDIDDLKQVVATNMKERERAADDATKIVDASVAAYERWLAHMAVAPALQQFSHHLSRLFRHEASRTFDRDVLSGVTVEQRVRMEQLLEVLASRLTASAGRGLRALVDEGRGDDAAAILTRLFGSPGGTDFPDSREAKTHDPE